MHHAALNCVRRIFAIVVTSIVFGVPITFVGAIGILLSFLGFISFTHAKTTKKQHSKKTDKDDELSHLSSLLPMGHSDDENNEYHRGERQKGR